MNRLILNSHVPRRRLAVEFLSVSLPQALPAMSWHTSARCFSFDQASFLSAEERDHFSQLWLQLLTPHRTDADILSPCSLPPLQKSEYESTLCYFRLIPSPEIVRTIRYLSFFHSSSSHEKAWSLLKIWEKILSPAQICLAVIYIKCCTCTF